MDWLSAIAVASQPTDPGTAAAFQESWAQLKAADGETRIRILRQRAAQSGPLNLAVLVAATADEDPMVRCEALERLRFSHPGWPRQAAAQLAVGTLREALHSASYWTRQAGLETLHRIAAAQPELPPAHTRPTADTPPQAPPPIALLLRTASDPDRNLRLACCEALARLGGPEATTALKQFEEDADEYVRTAAQVLPNQAGSSPCPDCAP